MKTCIKKSALLVLFNLIILSSFAQPGTNVKELKRKRHWVSGTYGHPYTTFDRHNGKTFDETLKEIRKRIKDEKVLTPPNNPVFLAYQQVYTHAISPRPTDKGMIIYNDKGKATAPSDLALWAKNNAYVMLIGLDENH